MHVIILSLFVTFFGPQIQCKLPTENNNGSQLLFLDKEYFEEKVSNCLVYLMYLYFSEPSTFSVSKVYPTPSLAPRRQVAGPVIAVLYRPLSGSKLNCCKFMYDRYEAMRVFDNGVPRKIFGGRRNRMTEGWTKFCKE
jgi:hypothetical protein